VNCLFQDSDELKQGLGPAAPVMLMPTPPALLTFLRERGFLTPSQVQGLGGGIATQYADSRALASELLARNWLTAFQADQLLQGRGDELLLGPYRLLDRLGEGGMGQVFKARHQLMNRIVAIKIIPRDRVSSPEAVTRFYQEVRAVAKLSHPNIIIAHDFSQAGETHFLVMEHVEGIDLARLVQQSGPLSIPMGCDCIRQAALGLQHAHEKGLVHRDIKPGNLMVARPNPAEPPVIKILDFGLARQDSENTAGTRLTQVGTIVGTVDYMAPEQAENARTADIRADIYSLGCSLFYLLTGQPPFPGETTVERLSARLEGRPTPIRVLRPEMPEGLERVLRMMLARDPARRFQTPAEVAAALEGFAKPQRALRQPARPAEPNPFANFEGQDVPHLVEAKAKVVSVTVESTHVEAAPSGKIKLKVSLRGGKVKVKLSFAVALLLLMFVAGAFLLGVFSPDTPKGRPVIIPVAVVPTTALAPDTGKVLPPVPPPTPPEPEIPENPGPKKLVKPKPVKPIKPEPVKPPEIAPNVEVGSYAARDNWPSLLLARQGEGHPWAVLSDRAPVSTEQTLLGLPGNLGLVVLKSGLDLMLWGDLPQFNATTPVLECVLTLHAPAAGTDLDFEIDRGRVRIVNRKEPPVPGKVRLRFLREEWDLELTDKQSEVVVELFSQPQAASAGPPQSTTFLRLFTKGGVQARTKNNEKYDLRGASLSWSSQERAPVRSSQPELPPWWANPPDRKVREVEAALSSLLDWSEILTGRIKPVVATIVDEVKNGNDPDNQDLGVLFLDALDEVEWLVTFLEDRLTSVRGAAVRGLQGRLARGSRYEGELVSILVRRGVSKDKAERVVRLLHFFSKEAVFQRKTYEDLIDGLDDDEPKVRTLSLWQLEQLGRAGFLPKEAADIKYQLDWGRAKRRPAIADWKKLVAAGRVPAVKRP
jgi:serine/threonine-protein kinase